MSKKPVSKSETESKKPVSKSEKERNVYEDDDMFNGLNELKNKCKNSTT